MGRPKKYQTEEERKVANREAQKRWRESNTEYIKQYQQEHKEELAEYIKQYNKTPIGRAYCLLRAYRQSDKIAGRGECTLTAKWIVENIFTQPCAHCGETDWRKIGCNRLDNSLPHTPDNVEPCCFKCNMKLPKKNP